MLKLSEDSKITKTRANGNMRTIIHIDVEHDAGNKAVQRAADAVAALLIAEYVEWMNANRAKKGDKDG